MLFCTVYVWNACTWEPGLKVQLLGRSVVERPGHDTHYPAPQQQQQLNQCDAFISLGPGGSCRINGGMMIVTVWENNG
jgi:hypothetical protein